MATQVTTEETVTLQDGTEVRVRPLNIKALREFMQVVRKFDDVDDDLGGLDLMIEAVQVAFRKEAPELAEDKDKLEEILDMPTIHKVMSVAGGVDLSGDPNLPVTG